MALNWKGDVIKQRMDAAARAGVNRTMALCVGGSKADHPFTNRTGTAERSIKIAQIAETFDSFTRGVWGSVMNNYFKFLELGTEMTRSRVSIVQRARLRRTGILHRKKNAGAPPWNGGSWAPTLVPEAKIHYPKLGRLINAAFMEGLR